MPKMMDKLAAYLFLSAGHFCVSPRQVISFIFARDKHSSLFGLFRHYKESFHNTLFFFVTYEGAK
jgi:hypothetical protein